MKSLFLSSYSLLKLINKCWEFEVYGLYLVRPLQKWVLGSRSILPSRV